MTTQLQRKRPALPENPNLIRIEDVMKIAGVSRRTVHSWMESGVISCIKIGRVIRIERTRFLEELAAFTRCSIS